MSSKNGATGTGAVLLDVDGTLVDSNYQHVQAWSQAFRDAGHPVDMWRIHRAIGMGSAELLAAVAGEAAADIGEQVKARHSELFADMGDQLRRFDGVHELVAALGERDVRVVLATSADPDELERLLEVLDLEGQLHAVTSAKDVERAKPNPDLVQAALEASGMRADRAVFVGDTVWDVRAAHAAHVPCVGVRTGGIGPQELSEAGAHEVYDDVVGLVENLETSLLARAWA